MLEIEEKYCSVEYLVESERESKNSSVKICNQQVLNESLPLADCLVIALMENLFLMDPFCDLYYLLVEMISLTLLI